MLPAPSATPPLPYSTVARSNASRFIWGDSSPVLIARKLGIGSRTQLAAALSE